jgi:recombination protein RecA
MTWLDELENKSPKKEFKMDIISTPYDSLNSALGINGLPKGKIIDLSGEKGSCKSTLALDIITSAWKQDLFSLYINYDGKLDKKRIDPYLVCSGNLLVYTPNDDLEKLLFVIQTYIQSGVDLIVFDSISQCANVELLLQNISQLISGTKVTVILLSQVRHNFKNFNCYNTPKMKVLNQYSNIRMNLKILGSIKKDGKLIGKKIGIDIYKNSVSKPNNCEIEVFL